MNSSAARVAPAVVLGGSDGQPKPQAAVATQRPSAAPSSMSPPDPLARASVPAAGMAPGGFPGSCPRCAMPVDPRLPFCAHCGTRVVAAEGAGTCGQCGAAYTPGIDLFCARCGNRVGQRVSVEMKASAPAVGGGTQVLGVARREVGPKLALLGEDGDVAAAYTLDRGEAVIGRGDADIRFERDHYMSPLHAKLEMREGQLRLRDLGSRNGSWVFIEQPTRLTDLDLVLVGSQVLRFRRLGYPGPHPPEADSTRRMGSLVPSADVAVLEQMRADGSVRDTFHLSPGRSISLGRETGDWIFPYDQTMSGRHAEVRSEDSEFYIHDAGSRNGVAMAVRGERVVLRGQRVLLGDQILRVESV